MPLLPFIEALALSRSRTALPTSLGSRELLDLDAVVRRQAFFSAKTMETRLLDGYMETLDNLLSPRTVTREVDGVLREVTEGIDPATARLQIKELQQRLGLRTGLEDTAGGITDLASDARIDLVLKTNTEMMQGFGQMVQQQDPDALDAFPALELVRFEDRDKERDWSARWLAAARESGDSAAVEAWGNTQRMVARKTSPVWDALGNGAGGYESDALGNPYPPFAFNSGMGVLELSREEAVELGLVSELEALTPRDVLELAPDLEAAA
jgi:hypothetical protein